MNVATKVFPIALRPEVPSTPAEAEWISDAVEHLLNRRDVQFQRRLHSPQGVSFERFALAIDEHITDRLMSAIQSNSVLGRLAMHARCKAASDAATVADELIGPDPEETLREIATKLLKPLAADALIAQFEDADS